jgi:hypothetical protein
VLGALVVVVGATGGMLTVCLPEEKSVDEAGSVSRLARNGPEVLDGLG